MTTTSSYDQEEPNRRDQPTDGGEASPSTRPGFFIKPVVISLLALLVFPILVAIAFFATLNLLPKLTVGAGSVPSGNGTLTGLQLPLNETANVTAFPNLPISDIYFPRIPTALILDVLVFLGLLIVAYAVVQRIRATRYRSRSSKGVSPFDEEESLANERNRVAAILEAAAAGLDSSSSYKETVLRCYKLISEVLERKASIDGRTLTAREFMRSLAETLNFESPYLSRVTELFEVAKYSQEEITSEQALQASDCLSNLGASFKEPSLTLSTGHA